MHILVATLRGAVHQQQRAAAYAALLPSLVSASELDSKKKAMSRNQSAHALSNFLRTPTATRSRVISITSFLNRTNCYNRETFSISVDVEEQIG